MERGDASCSSFAAAPWVSKVLGSKAFTEALDQLGWIPYVGWVLELRDRCLAAGIDCNQLGKQFETTLAEGPSSLGDPVPPTPPNPVEVQIGLVTFAGPPAPKKRRHSALTWALAAGVLGGAWALMRRR